MGISPDITIGYRGLALSEMIIFSELESCKKGDYNHDGIIDVTDEELVSIDFLGNPHSSIIDLNSTLEVGNNMFKVVGWYDNEWGYAHRTIDLLQILLTKLD